MIPPAKKEKRRVRERGKEDDMIVAIPTSKVVPIYKLGANPVLCKVPDASENPDRYL